MGKLLRMATEMLHARQQVYLGDWDYVTDPTEYFDNACTVIEGYQDLIRRIIGVLDQGFLHNPTTVSNMEFVIEGESLVNELNKVITEARTFIPEEKSHE